MSTNKSAISSSSCKTCTSCKFCASNTGCSHEINHFSCIECVPIFAGLSQNEKTEVANIANAVNFEKGEQIYSAGDRGGKLYVLHTGKVKVSRINANGKEQVLRIIASGEFTGELSLFSSHPLSDNAQALEDSTMCVIEGEKLKMLMAKYTSIAFKIMEELSIRLEKAQTLLESISLNTVEQRLAHALLSLSGKGNEVLLNMTKGDFASLLGMSQESLSRKLSAFQDEELIKMKGHRKIIIINREKLEAIQTDHI